MKNKHSCIGWVLSFGRRPFPSFVSVQYADQAREDYEHGKVVRELSTRGMGISRTDDCRLPRSVRVRGCIDVDGDGYGGYTSFTAVYPN